MVSIRLARIGKKKKPFYRVVVIDKRRPRNGRFVEIVGTYDPLKNPAEVKLDAERIKHWLGHGAKCSETVASFLKRKGVVLPRNARTSGNRSKGKAKGSGAKSAERASS